MAERLLLLGRQAPSSHDDYGIFIEPGARLHAWTPNHKQISSCKVAVHRACVRNEGVLDTKPRVTEEEKAAAKAAEQAHVDAATKMRIGEVVRRLKAAKDAEEHQAEELEEKHRRLMEFNARVKSGNAKRKHRSPGEAQQQHQHQQRKGAVEWRGGSHGQLAGEGADVIDLTLKPYGGEDQGAGAVQVQLMVAFMGCNPVGGCKCCQQATLNQPTLCHATRFAVCRVQAQLMLVHAVCNPDGGCKLHVASNSESANNCVACPPPMFAGHILPRYIQLSDRPNCQRARAKVAAMKKACPPLCGCGSGASPFSPTYTTRCACNCPLYSRPDLQEVLLNRFLQSADVI
ncbi:hypothetical protein DUNSADRAFT_8407 [Dunaliella salina]|uniref:Uncharacterized protein n=1 Tax=Dunaliella salina TaxID=3046 RepID=A0ABQ7GJP1_DUNSA|nr:hypothetical protein DUNSADRAFT_8407 [Dunaliella salina]|eukprot:KAF5834823.1 hypothetical protein DUNSADRAFT_8407 [Dunaliella salina]